MTQGGRLSVTRHPDPELSQPLGCHLQKRLGKSRDTAAELMEAFKIFDKDGNGTLTSADVGRGEQLVQLGGQAGAKQLGDGKGSRRGVVFT